MNRPDGIDPVRPFFEDSLFFSTFLNGLESLL